METYIQVILIDILINGVLYYTIKILEFILLSPIALIGLFVEYSRSGFVKVNRRLRKEVAGSCSPEVDMDSISRGGRASADSSPRRYHVIVRVSDLLLKLRGGGRPAVNNNIHSSSISSNGSKIYKKHGAIDFLVYLNRIKAKVYLYDENEQYFSACEFLKDKTGGSDFQVKFCPDIQEIVNTIDATERSKSMVIIDNDPRTCARYPNNAILVDRRETNDPELWTEILEQLRLSKIESVAKILPSII